MSSIFLLKFVIVVVVDAREMSLFLLIEFVLKFN